MFSLLPLFQRKLIPWAQGELDQRLIVARPVMHQSSLPSDVTLTQRRIPGKRVIVRNKRVYGNQRVFCASWPEAGLHELDIPKLVCVINGATDYQAGKYVINCNQGHFIFLPPRTPNKFAGHTFDNNDEGSCSLFQIHLYRDCIHCMMHHCRKGEISGEPGANCLIRHAHTVQTYKLLEEELLTTIPTNFEMSSHLLSALFIGMSREITAGHQLDLFHAPENKDVPNSVQEVRDYIKAHLREGLTIEKVARAIYISPSQFTHYIRQSSGQSFGEMLAECRIEEAKLLLQESKWALTVIANQLGLKSATYFGAFFKHHTGFTPGEYRQKFSTRKFQRKS